MEIITSKNNPKFVLAQKLKQKKYRQQFELVLLEGEKLILDALENNVEIDTLFTGKEKIEFLNKVDATEKFILDEKLCKALTTMVTSPNVFAVAKIPKFLYKKSNNVLVLDKVQNPDNLGAIIRSAVATNFTTIYAIDSVDIYNEKTLRSSMGNVFKVDFIKTDYQSLKTLLCDYQICVADMFGENIFKVNKMPSNVALVIGNEGNGISTEIMEICNRKFEIPMDNNVESLNASVSAGIIMYQIKTKQGE